MQGRRCRARGAPASIARAVTHAVPQRLRRHRRGAGRGIAGRPGRLRDRSRWPGPWRVATKPVFDRHRAHAATSRWPTWWRLEPASRRPSVGSSSSWPRRQWWVAHVAEPAGAAGPPRARLAGRGRGPGRRRPAAASPRAARHQLRVHRERLAGRGDRRWPGRRPAGWSRCQRRSARARPPGWARWHGPCGREVERVRSWRRLLTAYDVDRQLERGYSLTLRRRRVAGAQRRELTPGQEIVTRFADGTARSRIEDDRTGRGGRARPTERCDEHRRRWSS